MVWVTRAGAVHTVLPLRCTVTTGSVCVASGGMTDRLRVVSTMSRSPIAAPAGVCVIEPIRLSTNPPLPECTGPGDAGALLRMVLGVPSTGAQPGCNGPPTAQAYVNATDGAAR